MKTLKYFFVMAVILLAGCAQDDTLFETQDNLELKKAKVPIPFKGEWYSVPDMESGFYSVPLPWGGNMYITNRMLMSGKGSHLGKIDAEKSYGTITEMKVFLDENGNLLSVQSTITFLVAANGDSVALTSKGRQSWVDGSFVSQDEIIPGSGTGRFKGVTGSAVTVGGWLEDGVGVWSKSEGYLVYE
jgi:hypothetical protein